MKRLLRENVRDYAGWLVLALICMALTAGATGASAWLMEPMVNEVFVERNEDMLIPVGTAVIVVFVVKGLANYGQATLISYVGLRIIADNQKRLYDHLSHMDLAFFHGGSTGNLISRFLVDIGSMRAAVSSALTGFGKDLLTLIGLVGVIFYQDWVLATVSFFVFPIALLPIVKLGRRMRKVTANTQREMGLFTTLLDQTITGIRVVKAYGMEAYELSRVGVLVDRVFKLNMKATRTRAMASPIMETLGGLAIAVVIIYGGGRVIAGETDAGSFFSFITALLLAYEPLKRLANLNATLQTGFAGAQRYFQLLDTPPAIIDKPDAAPLSEAAGGTPEGRVTLNDVHFAYTEDKPALRGLSLEAAGGETIALVGPSGAGKSTILNLIPRFYDVDEGAVLIDGQNIRDVTLASLRETMALVSQEITLFDDTVRANIAYGRHGATQAEIEAAARNAAAHDFIRDLPDGYDTMVGEHGVKLSGGQRQRLAIARAMLKNAPILLLDEATSALDTEAERQIQAAVQTLMQGRTTLVIAHRLSTIIDSDRIYVIDKGRVAEHGTHAELFAQGGLYRRLYEMQYSHQDETGPDTLALGGGS